MSQRDTGVQLQSNGDYWKAVWYDTNGKRKGRSLGSKTELSERKANRECSKIASELALEPARRDAGGNMTLAAWCKRYLELRTDLTDSTRRLHETTIAYLLAFFDGGERRLDRITRSDAADWRVWITQKLDRAPRIKAGGKPETADQVANAIESTTCKHVRTVKTIVKHAMAEGHVGVNVFDHLVGTPPEADSEAPGLSESDVQRIIDAAPSPAWRALIGLCAWAGLRRGEALRLTWADIQWERSRIIVRTVSGRTTTKQRRREVLLEKRLERLLLDVHDQAAPGVDRVTDGISDNNLLRDMKGMIARAGFSVWAKPFHGLRRWRASTWRGDYPEHVVDSWLGHSMQVARKHYVQVADHYYHQGPSEAEQLRDENALLRRRLRRVLKLARGAKQ